MPVPAGELEPRVWAALHDLVCRVEVGEITPAEFCRRAAPALDLRTEQAAAMWDSYPRGTYAGAVELLDELRDGGVALACLSNTNAAHWQLLADPASHSYFPFDRLTHAFASHLLRLRKPDDAIYAHVEGVTGARGDRIVFFDDVRENIDGARRRGWRAYWIDPTPYDPIPQIREALKEHSLP